MTNNVARALAKKTAILLRAIKQITANINAVLKNDQLLDWDHVLLVNAMQTLLEHQIDALRARKKIELANKLDEERWDLACTLVKLSKTNYLQLRKQFMQHLMRCLQKIIILQIY